MTTHIVISDEIAAFAAALYVSRERSCSDDWGKIAFAVEVAGLGSYHPDVIEAAADSWRERHLMGPFPDPMTAFEAVARLRSLPKVTPPATPRPSHVRCIEKLVQGTWCGRDLDKEASFIGIDHAAWTGYSSHREACPECVDAIVMALRAVCWSP